ncbi:hypothetical protein PG991_010846 [Apiospora marii]|uniref:Carrier domain-containing protein n=1 Tax=Apiospora marii TaxID=335849 RepID=A0ABR1RCR1_9PEZI
MVNIGNNGASAKRQRTLLPHMVDQIASADPDAVYGMWPVVPTSYEAGFRSVTYSQLANVVNGLAWWLIKSLGRPDRDNEFLAYVGPNDVRIPALGLATVKAGYALFLTSPRNSAETHRSLFESLHCKFLLTPAPIPPAAQTILEAVAPCCLVVPSVEELLRTVSPPYDYLKTLEEGMEDPIMTIHTSGSTGVPKPLVWTQETVLKHQNASSYPSPEGVPSLESVYLSKRVLVTLPPFHGAGYGQSLLYAVPFGNTVIAPAAAAIVTAQGLVEALEQTPADIALLVPSVVAELAQNPDLLRYCAQHLELIVYIGGDLPQQVGDIVAAEMPLRCQFGASEIGMPPQLIPVELDPRKDWKYIRFHPCTGAVFDKVGDSLYELVIQRKEALAGTQPTFTIRGKEDLQEYRTRDLFAPHPAVPDVWAWQARADDIVVFLNGEKTNPISMEHHIVTRNPGIVSGALVIGTHRFQAALLIEPATPMHTKADQAVLIEHVWPSIEEANRVAPAHARVEKPLVFVTAPDRPLVRAGKGTLQRGASVALYKAEINVLYENADTGGDGDGVSEDDALSIDEILGDVDLVTDRIRDAVLKVTDWPALDNSEGFFERGMDSLQALRLTRALRRDFHRPHLGLSTIYQNPTAAELATALTAAEYGARRDDRYFMDQMLLEYQKLMHSISVPEPSAANTKAGGPIDVVLTGSTGTLGTMILRALLNRKGIGHVFCLNRGADGGRSAQDKKWAGLDADASMLEEEAGRVTFLHADLARPKLGLDQANFEMLQARVGLVIHSAWLVNFNLALPAFGPQLSGMVNLLSFAATITPRPAQVLFISSIGAVAAASSGPAPESVVRSLDTAHANGYSRSKLLAEQLCDMANKHLGTPIRIARVGQVAGPVKQTGRNSTMMWSRSEWLPSLVISSFHLGCLPSDLGPRFSRVDWMPSDLAAEAVVDLAITDADPTSSSAAPSTSERSDAGFFNLRNPHTTTWDQLIPALQDAARQRLGKELEVVSPEVWLQRLEQSESNKDDGTEHGNDADMASNPAIKLFAFYRDGLWADGPAAEPMAVERSVGASATLREMPAVQADWMRRWVEDWLGESK